VFYDMRIESYKENYLDEICMCKDNSCLVRCHKVCLLDYYVMIDCLNPFLWMGHLIQMVSTNWANNYIETWNVCCLANGFVGA
jgi:hypothetical protein